MKVRVQVVQCTGTVGEWGRETGGKQAIQGTLGRQFHCGQLELSPSGEFWTQSRICAPELSCLRGEAAGLFIRQFL